ncbi:MAG: NUDIX domain-containing protein [Candidatus Paceibacteria bacterium]
MSDKNFKQNLIDKLKNSTPELQVIHSKQSKDEFVKKNVFAGGVVLRPHTDGWKLALQTIPTKREQEFWGLPKGMSEDAEDNKEELLETAIREVKEEVGIESSELEPVHYLGRIERPSRTHNVWKEVHYFVFLTRQKNLEPHRQKHTARWFELEPEDLSMVPEQNEVIHSTINLLDKNGL